VRHTRDDVFAEDGWSAGRGAYLAVYFLASLASCPSTARHGNGSDSFPPTPRLGGQKRLSGAHRCACVRGLCVRAWAASNNYPIG
jgi:hypothetical protein